MHKISIKKLAIIILEQPKGLAGHLFERAIIKQVKGRGYSLLSTIRTRSLHDNKAYKKLLNKVRKYENPTIIYDERAYNSSTNITLGLILNSLALTNQIHIELYSKKTEDEFDYFLEFTPVDQRDARALNRSVKCLHSILNLAYKYIN